jgi:DNA polymerase-3 subunit epsilon/oligoribonuclease
MLGIFLDTETNGLNFKKHKILEIAYKIVDLKTGELKEEFESIVFQPEEAWKMSDPASLKVNGFTWDEVSHGNAIPLIAEQIITHFKQHGIERGKAVFICQNPSFDRVFFSQLIDPDKQEDLLWPYHWLDLASMYWAKSIQKRERYPWDTGFSKDKIATACQLPAEETPHRAMNGVNHLLLCYKTVVGFPCLGRRLC